MSTEEFISFLRDGVFDVRQRILRFAIVGPFVGCRSWPTALTADPSGPNSVGCAPAAIDSSRAALWASDRRLEVDGSVGCDGSVGLGGAMGVDVAVEAAMLCSSMCWEMC